MSKRTVILQEAEKWRKEGIITDQQYEQIAGRYPVASAMSFLPVFGAILLGLGVLTFIASNWQEMPSIFKLVIILLSLIACYTVGEWLHRKGNHRFGLAFTVVGVAVYGSGFFLIGQMYHLSGNPVHAFYLWFVGAISMAFYYRSKLLSYFSLLILAISACYGVGDGYRDAFSTSLFYLLFALGIGPALLIFRTKPLLVLSQLLLFAAAFYDLHRVGQGLAFPAFCLLFTVGSHFLSSFFKPLPPTIRTVSNWTLIFYSILAIFFGDLIPRPNSTDTALWVILLILSAGYLFVSFTKKQLHKWVDLILYAAYWLIYMLMLIAPDLRVGIVPSVVLIAALFLYAIELVLTGEMLDDISQINQGAALFGIACLVGYINLAWDFFDKSLFFLIGGGLLLALSLFVEWQRRKWVNEAKGGGK